MKRHIIHGILALCIVAASITVSRAQAICYDVSIALTSAKQFAEQHNGTTGIVAGDRAERFMTVFNAQEPVTDYKADMLVVVAVEGKGARFAILKDGCVVNVYTVDWDVFQRAMAAADSGQM